GGLDDLLGMYVIGRDQETREWLGWGHAWAHETAVVRRKSEASRFQDLVACGDMTIVRRDRETREWLGWGHAWAHETAVVRRKSADVDRGDLRDHRHLGHP
ncbi:hypothetical protein AAIH74_37400, partial [Pseudomonas aeruginosa]